MFPTTFTDFFNQKGCLHMDLKAERKVVTNKLRYTKGVRKKNTFIELISEVHPNFTTTLLLEVRLGKKSTCSTLVDSIIILYCY